MRAVSIAQFANVAELESLNCKMSCKTAIHAFEVERRVTI